MSTFALTVDPAELFVRATAVYLFLFLMFRFVVRRDAHALGVADVVFVVIVSEGAQNALTGDSRSIGDGMLIVTVLIGWSLLLDWLGYRFEFARRIVEPPPVRIIFRGRPVGRSMRREFISQTELERLLRENEVEDIQEVESAYLEADGKFTVVRYKSK